MNQSNAAQVQIKRANQIKRTKDVFDLDFFRSIPIDSVAEILGIEVNKKGFFPCPAHNDTKPSAQIRYKSNRWCCYVCGDGSSKSTIDLVMATEGLNFTDAVYFLNNYFPGGIKNPKIEEDTLLPPYMPPEILKLIGLKKDPFASCNVKSTKNIENRQFVFSQETLRLSYEEAAQLVIEKLLEYKKTWSDYTKNILQNFPKLDEKAISHIAEVSSEQTRQIEYYLEVYRDFLKEVARKAEYKSPWTENSEQEEKDV